MAALFPDAELLAKLVSFDSTSRNSNLPIADYICSYLDHTDLEIVHNPNEDNTKVNLVIRLRNNHSSAVDDRAGLILSGHMDVVPADEPDWQSDPFVLTESDDAYIGRGSCDMKGFVALAMNTAKRATQWSLTKPLVLILTYDEELGTLGAQHFTKTWHQPFALPRNAIIGEPTSLRVVRMHKGHLKMRITLKGKSAHSGYPHLGNNAIEPAGRVIAALTELKKQWQQVRSETSEFFPETPFVALNIAQIRGGSAINIIPDHCEIDMGIRLLPGMDSSEIIEQIRSVVYDLEDSSCFSVDVIDESLPLLSSESSEIHQTLCAMVSQSNSYGVSYASDAGPFQQMDMDCVLFGPGTIEVAHKPNESLPKNEFQQVGEVLEKIVRKMCCD